jgi:archaellum component FlaC
MDIFGHEHTHRLLAAILEQNNFIIKKLNKMDDLQTQIANELTQIKADYETVKKQNADIIAALQAQIAAGGGATNAQLQAILDNATTVDKEIAGDINTPASGATA